MEIFAIFFLCACPLALSEIYEQSSEEATVRVLLNCTGKFVGSETAQVIWGELAKVHTQRALLSSFTNQSSKPSFAKKLLHTGCS